jgi:general secretion pathway protein K
MRRSSDPTRSRRGRQSGAALLTAMLTVTLVATLAASALWQQWRSAEVEAAERGRLQASWVLIGGLDWSRLILREDARAGGADSLSEPWAVPLAEAKLTTFLAADKNISSDSLEGLPDAYLSGRIIDAQSKLNVLDLVDAGGKPVANSVAAFTKLFDLLGLPAQELSRMVANVQLALPANAVVPDAANVGAAAVAAAASSATAASSASAATANGTSTGTTGNTGNTGLATAASSDTPAPLFPQRATELGWLGLSPATVAALDPYVTVLPMRVLLNLNTASAEAIYASVPALDMAGAKRLVAARAQNYFKTLADAGKIVAQNSSVQFDPAHHGVSSRFFEVQARLRIDKTWVEEHSLVQRNGIDVRIVWRERGAGATFLPAGS